MLFPGGKQGPAAYSDFTKEVRLSQYGFSNSACSRSFQEGSMRIVVFVIKLWVLPRKSGLSGVRCGGKNRRHCRQAAIRLARGAICNNDDRAKLFPAPSIFPAKRQQS